MKHHYTIDLSGRGINQLMRGVAEYEKWVNDKTKEFVQKLAEKGVELASVSFAQAQYDGDNDVSVTWEDRGEFTRAVVATGKATLFIEFGAGKTLGYGHPEPLQFGPGTYPGKGHWDDPNGWYYNNKKKSMGNPPSASMYNARKELEETFESTVREVFGS